MKRDFTWLAKEGSSLAGVQIEAGYSEKHKVMEICFGSKETTFLYFYVPKVVFMEVTFREPSDIPDLEKIMKKYKDDGISQRFTQEFICSSTDPIPVRCIKDYIIVAIDPVIPNNIPTIIKPDNKFIQDIDQYSDWPYRGYVVSLGPEAEDKGIVIGDYVGLIRFPKWMDQAVINDLFVYNGEKYFLGKIYDVFCVFNPVTEA